MDTAHLIARLRAYAAARGWNKWEFARQAGLRDTVLRHFDRPEWNPTVETLRRLEALIPEGWQAGDKLPADTGEAA